MWLLFSIILVSLILMFFWVPGGERAVESAASTSRGETKPAPPLPVTGWSEDTWYGVTFRGYHDDYGFDSRRSPDEILSVAREYFVGRKAKVTVEQSRRMVLSRGRKLYRFLGGPDTWAIQEIEVALETHNALTRISIQYRVQGWHIRTPPNQLRREVLELKALV